MQIIYINKIRIIKGNYLYNGKINDNRKAALSAKAQSLREHPGTCGVKS